MSNCLHILKRAFAASFILVSGGFLYNSIRNTFFYEMSQGHITLWTCVAVLMLGMIVFTGCGFLSKWYLDRRNSREMARFLRRYEQDWRIIIEGNRTLNKEVNAELGDFKACSEAKEDYSGRGWETLVKVCDFIRRVSRIYNLDDHPDMKRDMEKYLGPGPAKAIHKGVVQWLDSTHELLTSKAKPEMSDMLELRAVVGGMGRLQIWQLENCALGIELDEPL